MINLTVFLLALGAVARITRFLTRDYLFRAPRRWAVEWTGNPDHDLPYLLTCPWCASVWVAAAVLPVAWFWGDTPGFKLTALVLTASYLVGVAASLLDPIPDPEPLPESDTDPGSTSDPEMSGAGVEATADE